MIKFLAKQKLIIPLSLLVVALVFGLFFFFSQWQYSEDGHETLLLIYVGLSLGLLVTSRFLGMRASVIVCLLMGLLCFYGQMKFEWRHSYIAAAQAGNYFALAPYISSYPTYEDHLLANYQNKPKYVAFNNDCFVPSLNNQPTDDKCQSLSLIENNYNIDVRSMINSYYSKMRTTAESIQNNAFPVKSAFENCINKKRCAIVPLLPASAGNIEQQSDEYLDIRKQFWSLIEDEEISPENCEFMDLCRAMRNIGVIAVAEPSSDIVTE